MAVRKNVIIITVLVLFWMVSAGCENEDQKQNHAVQEGISAEPSEKIPLTFPEVYEEEVDETLSFHASVLPPAGLQAENLEKQITYKTMDFDAALEEVFSDVGELIKEEMILQPENSLYQSAYNAQDEIITNSKAMLRMEKAHWAKVRNAIELSKKDLAYNAELYTLPQEFTFGTAEEVWDTLYELLQRLGVKTELRPTLFYMDYATMAVEDEKNKEKDMVSGEAADKVWTEEDNGYYISAVQCVDGNTVFANTYFGNGIEGEADTANILAYVDKDGVQMLEVTRIIDKIEETGTTWKMLPFEEIVAAVKRRFGLTISEDKVYVKKIQFSFMTEAVDEEVYRLLPVWFCNYDQTGQDGRVIERQIIIHAATGEEVIYELY